MTFQIQLRTVEDIKRFQTKIIGLKIQLFEFQAITLRELANEIILERIHEKMRIEGFSEKIIDGTILDNIELIGRKKARLYFSSEYFSKTNFDVALGREEGTDDHFIEPLSAKSGFKKKPKALHGGSKWPYFSKGHDVSGVPALEIVSTTVKEMAELLQDEYNRQLNLWISKNLEGIVVAS